MMRRILALISFAILGVAQIGAVSAADGAGSCAHVAAAPADGPSAAELLVRQAVPDARTADAAANAAAVPATATVITASLDGPTAASCSLCYVNCLIPCLSAGGTNCERICRSQCPGPQCEP